MRSFMLIGVLLDQIMWTHSQNITIHSEIILNYQNFFLTSSGFASPNWFVYSPKS